MAENRYHHLVEESHSHRDGEGEKLVMRRFKIMKIMTCNSFVIYKPDPPGNLIGGSLEVLGGEPAGTPEIAIEQWKDMIRRRINRRRAEIGDLESLLLNPQIEYPTGWARDD